jgi:molybdenum cofactor cytidylyltransferase
VAIGNPPGMIQGLLLAAGGSTRFGSDKLTYPLPNGTPMALAAAHSLCIGTDNTLVVVDPINRALKESLQEAGHPWLACPEAAHGMGHSLAWGVRATATADGWVVALADMPYVLPATVAAIANALREGASLAAPVYRGRRGHPVGFAGLFRDALLTLHGDRGARDILAAHPGQLKRVACEDPAVLIDIDRPGDVCNR